MSEKKPPSERISAVPPFGLRMLPELRERIAAAAAANDRSMNSEIVARLEESFMGSDTKLWREHPDVAKGYEAVGHALKKAADRARETDSGFEVVIDFRPRPTDRGDPESST